MHILASCTGNRFQSMTPSSNTQEKPKLPALRLEVGSPIGDALRELGYGQDLLETAFQGEITATHAMQSATSQAEYDQALEDWRTSRTLLNTALGIGQNPRTKLFKGLRTEDSNGFPFINRCKQALINHLHQRGGFPLTGGTDTMERAKEMLLFGIGLDNEVGNRVIRSVMRIPGMNTHLFEAEIGTPFLPLVAQIMRYSAVRTFTTIPGINVNEADSDGITALHWVAQSNGNPQTIQALLDAGANPNQTDKMDQTPLYMAAIEGNPYDVQTLLDGGANPNQANHNGHTPLHIAVVNQNSDAMQALLEAGADPNQADLNGETPLHWAATEGNLEAIRALLNAGAAPNKKNHQGRIPLSCARSPEAKLLLQRANPSFIQTVKKHLHALSCLN